ncbi:response regulator [Kiloniella antarctica]|uniref:Response regulator n=1 Tax=Kiloniella antarctica TaxID=1550907 RepID=A0ABW5BK22_9PROT
MDKTLDFGLLDFCVAEDDSFMQKLVKTMLISLGAKNIRLASDGTEAYELLRIKAPDLIFIDWTMKPTTGIDLVKKIREDSDPIISSVPIIMLTAHSKREFVEKAVIAGANDYLVKPVSPLLLQKRIEAIFKNRIPLSHQPENSTAPLARQRRNNNNLSENDETIEISLDD